MKRTITRTDTYSLGSIPTPKSETVTAFVTVDLHTEHTVSTQALHLMYGDALLSGTTTHTREEFLNAVNILGASIHIDTNDGTLTITLKSTAATFGKLLTLTEAMLTSPAFSTKELARIKTVTINDLYASKEQSKEIAHENLLNTFYGYNDRKYSYDIDETIAAVSAMSNRQLKAQHSTLLRLNWTCSIAGTPKIISQFDSLIKKIKKTQPLVINEGVHQQKPPVAKTVLTPIPSRQNIDFSIGAPLPITLHHPDYIPLTFALAVLGKWGGFTGRLMSTVREKEGLTYGIYSKAQGFSGTEQGYWYIMTFFAPEKALQGLSSTFREITRLYTHGITETELNTFKVILGTQQTLLQDSAARLLADLHSYNYHQFTIAEIDTHKARMNSLTVAEVNHVITTYLNPNTLTISGAGPTDGVKKSLLEFHKTVS